MWLLVCTIFNYDWIDSNCGMVTSSDGWKLRKKTLMQMFGDSCASVIL